MNAPDNPIWQALRSDHAALGSADDLSAAYHAEVAPFVGVAAADARYGAALAGRLGERETCYLVGVIPPQVPGWQLHDHGVIDQMVCAAAPEVPPGPPAVELRAGHLADMLALTVRDAPRGGRRAFTQVTDALEVAGEVLRLHRQLTSMNEEGAIYVMQEPTNNFRHTYIYRRTE